MWRLVLLICKGALMGLLIRDKGEGVGEVSCVIDKRFFNLLSNDCVVKLQSSLSGIQFDKIHYAKHHAIGN